MATPPQRFVSRKYVRARIQAATGARIDPAVYEPIESILLEEFEGILEQLAQAHAAERDLRSFHAAYPFQPMVRPRHVVRA